MLTASDVLLRAVDIIHEHGWCQNSLQTLDGRVCLAGALQHAAGALFVRNADIESDLDFDPNGYGWMVFWPGDDDRARQSAFHRASDLVHTYLRNEVHVRMRMDVWNDKVATSADDVIEVLKRASELD